MRPHPHGCHLHICAYGIHYYGICSRFYAAGNNIHKRPEAWCRIKEADRQEVRARNTTPCFVVDTEDMQTCV